MVREFRLLNEKGQEYSLMNIHNYCLLTEPDGLGYSYTSEYEQLENTFVESFRKITQSQITGTLNFLSYDNYKNFIDFIEASEKLRFAYKIPFKNGSKEYLKDVNIQSITKTQIQLNKVISETVTFDCLSLWYSENTTIYDMKHQANEFRWDFRWDPIFRDYNTRTLDFINDGHIEAPILLEIDGPVTNPSLELYVEGDLYQTLNLNIQIKEYEKILYCSRENEFYINKENTDGTLEDLFNLDVINFEEENVLRLPKNKSCTLKIKADTDITNAKVTVLVFYKAI